MARARCRLTVLRWNQGNAIRGVGTIGETILDWMRTGQARDDAGRTKLAEVDLGGVRLLLGRMAAAAWQHAPLGAALPGAYLIPADRLFGTPGYDAAQGERNQAVWQDAAGRDARQFGTVVGKGVSGFVDGTTTVMREVAVVPFAAAQQVLLPDAYDDRGATMEVLREISQDENALRRSVAPASRVSRGVAAPTRAAHPAPPPRLVCPTRSSRTRPATPSPRQDP